MDKNDDIYVLLSGLGLEDKEIQEINRVNVYLSKVLDSDVLQILKYLEEQGLNVDEIMEISIKNPWVLTESFERIRLLEKHYKNIGIEEKIYKDLLVKYPISISINPLDVKNKIEEFEKEGLNKDEIREKIMIGFNEYFKL